MLDNCSIDIVSIEVYENQFFKSDFTLHNPKYIYKDIFKGRHS